MTTSQKPARTLAAESRTRPQDVKDVRSYLGSDSLIESIAALHTG